MMIKSQSPPIAVRAYNENNRAVEKTVFVGANSGGAARSYLGKLVILGESGVGKTQFSVGSQRAYNTSYGNHRELPPEAETIGTSFHVVPCQIDADTVFRAQIWDTAGQERFRSMMPMYMRDAHGAVLMFDLTSRRSFDEAKDYWLEQVRQHMRPDGPIVLVGNKSDAVERRVVTRAEAEAVADEKRLLYVETTALITASLHHALATIATNMYFYQVRNKCLSVVHMPSDSMVFEAIEDKKKKCCGKQ